MNILDLVKEQLSPELVGKAASMLGENEGGVSKAISGLVPTLLGALSNNNMSSNTFNLLSQAGENSSGLLGNLTGLLGGNDNSATSNIVSSLATSILGDKVGSVVSGIANFAGIGNSSSKGLLSLATGVIGSVLGKKILGEGLNLSSLTSLLGSQKNSFSAAMPTGLSTTLGLSNLFAEGKETVSHARDTASRTVHNVTEKVEEGGSSLMRWLLPLLLLLLLLGLLFWLFKTCNHDKGHDGDHGHGADTTALHTTTPATTSTTTVAATDTTKTTATTTTTTAATTTTTTALKLNADGTATYDLGAMITKKLPNGTEIKYAERGSEAELLKFIETGTVNEADKTQGWINLYDVQFTKNLTYAASADAQIKNIAAILKAYPKVQIKLGGYTDNTGPADVNQKLSQQRAEKVKADLGKAGVSAQITKAEGYGPEHPVCAANDTPECKAQNRRVSCRVTAK